MVVYAMRPVKVLLPVPKYGYRGKNVYIIKYSHNGETRYYCKDEVYPWCDNPDDATPYYSMMDAAGVMQDFIDEWDAPPMRLKVQYLYEARLERDAGKEQPKPAVRISCDGRWVEVTQEAFTELLEQSGKCEAFDEINKRFGFVGE
jgi:hypothetical protein